MIKKPAFVPNINISRARLRTEGPDQQQWLKSAIGWVKEQMTLDRRDARLPVLLAALLLIGSFAFWWTYPATSRYPANEKNVPDMAASFGEIGPLLTTETMPISAVEAETINAARSDEIVYLASAKPFVLPSMNAGTSAGASALRCLTQAIYYEAASESDSGQRAVAQVVLNRMRHSAFPKSVCGVVYQGSQLPTGCQFSFTCDDSLARKPSAFGWARAHRVASSALAGWVEPSVGLATHYHANYVVPYWASSLDKAKTIGAHLFYLMRGSNSRPAAFTGRYDPLAEGIPGVQIADVELPAVEELKMLDEVVVPTAAPNNRTQVREDATGTLLAPSAQTQATVSQSRTGPRADDGKSKIGADERVGILVPK